MARYMIPLKMPPREDALSSDDRRHLQAHFDANNFELNIDGQIMEWNRIDEIEVAKAARTASPAGWLVKNLVYGGADRYHVGVYSGHYEAVLPNLSLEAARYVVQMIAYHLRDRVRYTGPEGITPLDES